MRGSPKNPRGGTISNESKIQANRGIRKGSMNKKSLFFKQSKQYRSILVNQNENEKSSEEFAESDSNMKDPNRKVEEESKERS